MVFFCPSLFPTLIIPEFCFHVPLFSWVYKQCPLTISKVIFYPSLSPTFMIPQLVFFFSQGYKQRPLLTISIVIFRTSLFPTGVIPELSFDSLSFPQAHKRCLLSICRLVGTRFSRKLRNCLGPAGGVSPPLSWVSRGKKEERNISPTLLFELHLL